jgi:fumarylpyruvate hydrolase
MGGDATKEPPFFFTKPADAVVPVRPGEVGRVAYPARDEGLPPRDRDGRRDRQGGREDRGRACARPRLRLRDRPRHDAPRPAEPRKETRRPWDTGKSFAQAAPIGVIVPASRGGHRSRGAITLDVNGTRRQTGDLGDMIWDTAHMIAFLSRLYELLPGDLIYTGTPSGVGAVVAGDRLDAHVDGLPSLAIEIVAGR